MIGMRKKSRRYWIPLITVLLISVWLRPAGAEDQHSVHEEFHRHHMGLLLGNTQEGHENGFTIGADYEYRLTKLVGLGGVAEYIGGDFDSFVLSGLFFIHPYRGLRFVLGPGFENRDSDNKFFLRAGVGYRFHVGDAWTIAPELNVDFFERDEALVYGVSIGRGF
jgi:hypothetical protein